MIPPTWRLALSRDMKRVRNNGGGGGGMEIVAFYRSVNRLVARALVGFAKTIGHGGCGRSPAAPRGFFLF